MFDVLLNSPPYNIVLLCSYSWFRVLFMSRQERKESKNEFEAQILWWVFLLDLFLCLSQHLLMMMTCVSGMCSPHFIFDGKRENNLREWVWQNCLTRRKGDWYSSLFSSDVSSTKSECSLWDDSLISNTRVSPQTLNSYWGRHEVQVMCSWHYIGFYR
jgi:hypothetical protein